MRIIQQWLIGDQLDTPRGWLFWRIDYQKCCLNFQLVHVLGNILAPSSLIDVLSNRVLKSIWPEIDHIEKLDGLLLVQEASDNCFRPGTAVHFKILAMHIPETSHRHKTLPSFSPRNGMGSHKFPIRSLNNTFVPASVMRRMTGWTGNH